MLLELVLLELVLPELVLSELVFGVQEATTHARVTKKNDIKNLFNFIIIPPNLFFILNLYH